MAVVFGVAVRWEDWHLREIYLDLDFKVYFERSEWSDIVWCWRLVIKL